MSPQFKSDQCCNMPFYEQNQGWLHYNLLMSVHRRVEAELDISRRLAAQQEFELSRHFELERMERENEYIRLKEAEKLRAQQDYDEYVIRRDEQRRLTEAEMYRERSARQLQLQETLLQVQGQRKARQLRDFQLDKQQRLAEEEELRRVEAFAAEKNLRLEAHGRKKLDIDRQNLAVVDEQKQQEKLESELNEIEITIGAIHDARETRKRAELQELEQLDIKRFKLTQSIRSSKVKQQALEESLAELSKLIV